MKRLGKQGLAVLLFVVLATNALAVGGTGRSGGDPCECSADCIAGSCSCSGYYCSCSCGGFLGLFPRCTCEGQMIHDPLPA